MQNDPDNLYGGAYDDEADRLPPLGPGVGGAIYDTPSGQYALPMQPVQQVTPDQLSDWASTPDSSEAGAAASGTLIKQSKGMINLNSVFHNKAAMSPKQRIYDTVENLAVAVQQEPQYDRINPVFGVLHFRMVSVIHKSFIQFLCRRK